MFTGLEHIHTATCRQLLVRTRGRMLWKNAPHGIGSSLVKSFLWGFGGYMCLNSIFVFAIPWLLKSKRPESKRARRPLFNAGWDTLHHILARLAAVAPEVRCELHHLDLADPAWGLRFENGINESMMLRLDVDDIDNPTISLDILWKGIEIQKQGMDVTSWPWTHLDTLKISGEGHQKTFRFKGKLKVADKKELDEAVVSIGRWFEALMQRTHHGPERALPPWSGALTITQGSGETSALETLPEQQSVRLQPAYALIAKPSLFEIFTTAVARFLLLDSIIIGMIFYLLINLGLVMVVSRGQIEGFVYLFMTGFPLIGIIWWMVATWYGSTKRPTAPVERIVLQGSTLGYEGGDTLDMRRPFNVELTRSINTKRPSVGIELRQRAQDSPEVRRVAFQVQVTPNASIEQLPALDRAAGWVPPSALKGWIWPAIQAHTMLHGTRIPWSM